MILRYICKIVSAAALPLPIFVVLILYWHKCRASAPARLYAKKSSPPPSTLNSQVLITINIGALAGIIPSPTKPFDVIRRVVHSYWHCLEDAVYLQHPRQKHQHRYSRRLEGTEEVGDYVSCRLQSLLPSS